VVLKLLNVVQPHVMYLGQKDAAQCIVLRKLARDLCLPSEVSVLPTLREEDGLAMSSRNRYLSPEERRRASTVPAALLAAKAAFAAGERRREALFEAARNRLKEESSFALQYLSLMDDQNGEEQEEAHQGDVLSIAGKLGVTRLIDALKI